MAERIGLIPGFALDLSVSDPQDNMPWDFNIESKRVKAEEMVRSKSSLLLVVSPMCAAFSRLQRLNYPKMNPEKVKQLVEYGVKRLEFCMRLCRIQHENGLYFLFEHPASATSWDNRMVKRLMGTPGVERVVGHMCQFDMKQKDNDGVGMVKKPTGFLTNAHGIARRLDKKCTRINCAGKLSWG